MSQSMAQAKKYEDLPDIDKDPDIYETPELTENTTLPSSTVRSESQASSYDDQSDDDTSGIDRRRIALDSARGHFRPSRVDARGVDFSDRIRRQRRSYRTSQARSKRRGSGLDDDDDDEVGLGDFSDDEDESLERKLARLRREVEEVKNEYGQRREREKAAGEAADEQAADDPVEGIAKLSDMLDEVYVQRQGGIKGAEAQFQRTLKRFAKTDTPGAAVVPAPEQPQEEEGGEQQPQLEQQQQQQQKPSTPPASAAPPAPAVLSQETAQALAKTADFDARLASLEKALGLNATNMPDLAATPPRSILHALDALEQQLTTIADVSSNSLDSATRRVQKLTQEAERLDELRRAAKAAAHGDASAAGPMSPGFAHLRSRSSISPAGPLATGPLPSPGAPGDMLAQHQQQHQQQGAVSPGTDPNQLHPPPTPGQQPGSPGAPPGQQQQPGYLDDPERVAKINALYGTLHTIETLAPSLPLVLERLRSLRLIHVGAGTASATLEELEKRQAEMDDELRAWRGALEGVEAQLREGEEKVAGNVKVVGEWVRDLEARIQRFG